MSSSDMFHNFKSRIRQSNISVDDNWNKISQIFYDRLKTIFYHQVLILQASGENVIIVQNNCKKVHPLWSDKFKCKE